MDQEFEFHIDLGMAAEFGALSRSSRLIRLTDSAVCVRLRETINISIPYEKIAEVYSTVDLPSCVPINSLGDLGIQPRSASDRRDQVYYAVTSGTNLVAIRLSEPAEVGIPARAPRPSAQVAAHRQSPSITVRCLVISPTERDDFLEAVRRRIKPMLPATHISVTSD